MSSLIHLGYLDGEAVNCGIVAALLVAIVQHVVLGEHQVPEQQQISVSKQNIVKQLLLLLQLINHGYQQKVARLHVKITNSTNRGSVIPE